MTKEEAKEWRKEDERRLHEAMDKEVEAERRRCRRKGLETTSGQWEAWSKAVERSWVKHIGVARNNDRGAHGRGKCVIIEAGEAKSKKERPQDFIKCSEEKKTYEDLKQARRCEQFATRIQLAVKKEEEEGKRRAYEDLNKDAMKRITSRCKGEQWK